MAGLRDQIHRDDDLADAGTMGRGAGPGSAVRDNGVVAHADDARVRVASGRGALGARGARLA